MPDTPLYEAALRHRDGPLAVEADKKRLVAALRNGGVPL
jgi:hypothetical protein